MIFLVAKIRFEMFSLMILSLIEHCICVTIFSPLFYPVRGWRGSSGTIPWGFGGRAPAPGGTPVSLWPGGQGRHTPGGGAHMTQCMHHGGVHITQSVQFSKCLHFYWIEQFSAWPDIHGEWNYAVSIFRISRFFLHCSSQKIRTIFFRFRS